MFRPYLAVLFLLAALKLDAVTNAADRARVLSSCGCRHCLNSNCTARGEWFVSETANFSVWSRQSSHHAVETAEHCEHLRARLQSDWRLELTGAWHPKCAVVIHAGVEGYRRELGDRSVGCTTITCDDGRIVFRRIDLRADASDWQSNALPHELTHVVLADRFEGRPLPSWLNEGLAMLSENDELHERRAAVLATALRQGTVLSLQTVLAAGTKLTHRDPDLAYAVSASIVKDLERQLGRKALLDLADQWAAGGAIAPTSELLTPLGGIEEWERRWLESIRGNEPAPNRTSDAMALAGSQ